jgi:hypothetical protein
MRYSLLAAAVMPALLIGVNSAKATLLYSFEAGDSPNQLDGFAHNGGGIAVSSSTIGATNGLTSMQLTTTKGATFTGALSTSPVPLGVLNTPGVNSVTFDLTGSTPAYAGTFADIGVTIFVENAGLGEFGEQFQTNFVPTDNINLPAGTTVTDFHPLVGANPDTFAQSTWPQMLAAGFTATGFEFFINNDASASATVYVDNVNSTSVPEPASLGAVAVCSGMALVRRRRRSI